ncbi:tyrosine-type recombinase/integrase [Sphingobium phenoxybenzoativorans]|uniref:tyrosine-type recombinase/integrase n=1 Tax=Sphingobium phenoxybenzoativorans TaxID=1592790 RepID=UPI0008731E1A|nr:integrase arm-type DNA-binding domain-containing protein [Sphingobium phenoxybenzoativorans]
MLTDMAVRQAKPRTKDYKLADSEGLYLFISKAGLRSWRFKYRFAGKERRLVLGRYPDIGLKQARELKAQARNLLVNGRDPKIEAAKEKLERTKVATNTFENQARTWYSLQQDRWTPVHARDVIRSLEKEVFPSIGSLPISEIDEPIVLSVLRKIERRGAIETAHRVRQRMSAVFVHAIAEGAGTRDPAAVVTKALMPVPRAKKRPALVSLGELKQMLQKTEEDPASPLTKLASRFLALTAQRPGMVRALPWSEIEKVDWQSERKCPEAIWRVPAHRMKLEKELKLDVEFEHLVPLSHEAVEVLRAAWVLTGRGNFVFPSSRSARRPMSENTLSYFYNRSGFQGRHVPHGWRASFSTIMNEWAERNGSPGDRHVIDMILAHIPNSVSGSEAAYNRAAYMDRRRELLQAWGKMLFGSVCTPLEMLGWPSREKI